MSPSSKCPVCGSTSIKAVKHLKTKAVAGYKCSRGHTFQTARPERFRARELRKQASETRLAANKQIERAHKLLGKRHS